MLERDNIVTSSREQSRKNAILLASFRLYLLGYPEKKILKIGASKETIQRCANFYDSLLDNKNCVKAGASIGIGGRLSHTMKKMFIQWQNKEEITCHLRFYKQTNKIPTIYSLLLSDISEHELLATGYTKDEVEKAKIVDSIVRTDKLYSVLSKDTGIPVNTLKRLKKTYNEYQENVACLM